MFANIQNQQNKSVFECNPEKHKYVLKHDAVR